MFVNKDSQPAAIHSDNQPRDT